MKTQIDKDTDYDCHYTIKRYHSEKVVTEDGWYNKKIELQPLNSEYKKIDISEYDECQIKGIFRGVL